MVNNGLAVTTVTATDANGCSPTLAISDSAEAGHFTIDAATGVTSVRTALAGSFSYQRI
ncbi:hypothetical protein [Synechococcus sp. CCAP 1479/9]|uniref:hypothetical protein n=1 Tax=Synechococcus sp. CCAP 1479/9 TaxID=1221593 RepID=UPI001C21E2AB|nr:hypothetical protein [Synechococcus sp. CCAP 1479/9]